MARTHRGEKAQTDRVTPDKDVIGEVLFIKAEKHRRENRDQKHEPDQFLISNPVHRTAVNQEVTHNPAAKGCGEREHKDADRVALHTDADKNTGERESNNTDHVGEIKKVYLVIESLKRGGYVHDNSLKK